jgi:hypothetical protein
MSREYGDEPTGAVMTATEIIKGLSGDNRAFPPDELIRLFHEEELTSQDLLEGFATLVYAFTGCWMSPCRRGRARHPPHPGHPLVAVLVPAPLRPVPLVTSNVTGTSEPL